MKIDHVFERTEQRSDPFPLDSDTTAVDQAHLGQAARPRLFEVFASHVLHVRRAERVEIERVLDRDLDWGVVVQAADSMRYNPPPIPS